jgi:hypothetical protein
MAKNGFRLAVTMHPQIVLFIHQVLSINIDFTFKRVEGNMDEWEVASMSDRFKQRSSEDLDFVSLPRLIELTRTYFWEFVLRRENNRSIHSTLY